MKRSIRVMAVAAGIVWIGLAQGQETFKGRLAPVPVDAKTRPDTGGFGSASAVLTGSKLTVSGTFNEFRSVATTAQLRQSKITGIRGTVVGDLTVTKGVMGTISGSFDLTPAQVDAVKKGMFYVQIHSEKAPEGNVWGWLLK